MSGARRGGRLIRALPAALAALVFLRAVAVGSAEAAPSAPVAAPAAAPATAPSPAAPAPALTGRTGAAPARWSGATLAVFAAPFSGDDKGEGIYTFDAQRDRSAPLSADGSFRLLGLPAGRYVLVVGPSAEQGVPVVDAQGRVRVFEVAPEGAKDLGVLRLQGTELNSVP